MRLHPIIAVWLASVALAGCECAGRIPDPYPGRRSERDAAPERWDAGASPTSVDASLDTFFLSRHELCGNEIDDDLNGYVDDGCPCEVGDRLACYAGFPSTAGVGTCVLGVQVCVAGSPAHWSDCVGSIAPAEESCGDGFDEDCDGRIDEGCSVASGAQQSCFPASPAQVGVGACALGTQASAMGPPGPDGVVTLVWGTCEGGIGPVDETCNGIDDDCNGAIDDILERCNFLDDDCDGAIDEDARCPHMASVYWTRYYPPTGSGVLPASTAELYTQSAMITLPSAPCLLGQVLLESAPGDLLCVPAPPTDCAAGTHYEWHDRWDCVPCDILVQFGGLFAYERTCAPAPRLTCPPGQTATYLEGTRTWACIGTCNDGTYDADFYDGALVCIPC